MSIHKRGSRWCYYIKIKGTRYRGTIPEARTKYQAQQAETRIRNSIFEGKYGTYQSTKTFRELVEKEFLPWSGENKRSWRNDFSRIKPLLAFFGSKRLAEISSFLIEKYKISRSKTITERGTKRSPTTVNREIQLLSRVYRWQSATAISELIPASRLRSSRARFGGSGTSCPKRRRG